MNKNYTDLLKSVQISISWMYFRKKEMKIKEIDDKNQIWQPQFQFYMQNIFKINEPGP